MKLIFNGLGPNKTFNDHGTVYKDGDVAEFDEAISTILTAQLKLAVPHNSVAEEKVKKLISTADTKRKEVVKKMENTKKGDE